MEIRPFQESDHDCVVALWTNIFGYSAPHNDPKTVIRHKLGFQRELVFVARVDDRVVGTIMCGYDGHRGWIYSLAVQADSRRQGIGSALMRHAEQQLRLLGCLKINLQLFASNVATVAFYREIGYAVEERISMGKLLDLRS